MKVILAIDNNNKFEVMSHFKYFLIVKFENQDWYRVMQSSRTLKGLKDNIKWYKKNGTAEEIRVFEINGSEVKDFD